MDKNKQSASATLSQKRYEVDWIWVKDMKNAVKFISENKLEPHDVYSIVNDTNPLGGYFIIHKSYE